MGFRFPSPSSRQTDPLELPATRALIESLFRAGYIGEEARQIALEEVGTPQRWWLWTSRMLLFVGSSLVFSGIVFFFAYNWSQMGRFTKLGLAEGGIVLCLAAAWLVGLDRVAGKVLLLGAAMLVGVFLAVYGQIYQTGADAYELFAGWAVIIALWVVISRFDGLWFLWITLVNTAFIFYWVQVLAPEQVVSGTTLCLVLAGLNGAALVGREWTENLGIKWLVSLWYRKLLLAAVLAYLTIPTVSMILDGEVRFLVQPLAVFSYCAGLGVAYWYFRYVKRDLLVLTLCIFSICVVLLFGTGKIIFRGQESPGHFLLFAVIVVGIFTAATFVLRWNHRTMMQENSDVS